ncbi:MAG: FG-GAP-like repeat-containing protein [Candidatus Hodarchaeales archaeon]|jgi:hypothetical protein
MMKKLRFFAIVMTFLLTISTIYLVIPTFSSDKQQQNLLSRNKQFATTDWPVEITAGFRSTPAVANIDNDAQGTLELVIGDIDGSLHVLNGEGIPLNGWPRVIGTTITSSPVVADVDGDNQLEIFIGTGDGYIYGLNHDGTNITGWPVLTGGAIGSSPAIGDIDDDNNPEIVVGSNDGNIWALEANGGNVIGFPVYTGSIVSSTPALVNVDDSSDLALEIIIGTSIGDLYVIKGNGANVTGFPVNLGASIESSPAVGKINADLYIAACTSLGNVYIIKADGTNVTGWPWSSGVSITSNPVLADLNKDGDNEIYIGTNQPAMFSYSMNNDFNWAQSLVDNVVSTPAIADIDKDGYMEIIFAGLDGVVHSWNYDGTPVDNFPVTIPGGEFRSSPIVVDLDSDDKLEVIVATEEGKIHMINTESGGHAPWSCFKGNSARSNFAKDSDNDGLLDSEESHFGTRNDSGDTDSDLLPDSWEIANLLGPIDATDANLDPDQDGLTNLEEFQGKTDPNVSDLKPGELTEEDALIQALIIIGAIIIIVIVGSGSFLLLARSKGIIMKTGKFKEEDLPIKERMKEYQEEVAMMMAEEEKTRIISDIMTPADEDIEFIDDFGVKDLEISYTYEIQRIIDRLEQTRNILAYDIILEQQQSAKNLKNKWLAEKEEVKMEEDAKEEIDNKINEVLESFPKYIQEQNEAVNVEISSRKNVFSNQLEDLKTRAVKQFDINSNTFVEELLNLTEELRKTTKSVGVFSVKLDRQLEYLKQQDALKESTSEVVNEWKSTAGEIEKMFVKLSMEWDQKAIGLSKKFLDTNYKNGIEEKEDFKSGLETWIASGNIEEARSFMNFSYTKTRTIYTNILSSIDRFLDLEIMKEGDDYIKDLAKKTNKELEEIEKYKESKEKELS